MATFAQQFIDRVTAYEAEESSARRTAIANDDIKQRKSPRLWREVRTEFTKVTNAINVAAARKFVHIDLTADRTIQANLMCCSSATYRRLNVEFDHANDILDWKSVGSNNTDLREGHWKVVVQDDGDVRFDGFHAGPVAVAEALLEAILP